MMPHIKPWTEVAPRLVDVATGRAPAELVVRNCRLVNVYSGEIIAHTDVAVAAGRFAFVGADASHAIGEGTKVIEADGCYMVPGLCDGHMHVESGMITVTEFCRAVIPHGTTSMFIDPHEIANVLGLAGVRLMHDEAAAAPIGVYVQMPSCVPSAPGLETAGAELGPDDVAEAMTWPNIIGLGEVMNFPGVAANDPRMTGEIAATVLAGKTVGGHYASPVLGRDFHGYVAGGPADDHEGTRLEDAIARVRQGMRAMLRLGSAWYDVAAQIKAVTEYGLDPRNFILCTDDSHSGTLVHEGHMDRVVRHAIAQGLAPVTAIQMATLNTAQHFAMEREIGSVAPGRRADFLLVPDLPAMQADQVFAAGRCLAAGGEMVVDIAPYPYPESARNTVNVGRRIGAEDFDVAAPTGAESVRVRVIGVIENQAPTRALEADLTVEGGLVMMDRARRHLPGGAGRAPPRHRQGGQRLRLRVRLRQRLRRGLNRRPRQPSHDRGRHQQGGHGAGRQPPRRGRRRRGGVRRWRGKGAGRDADCRADVGPARRDRGRKGRQDGQGDGRLRLPAEQRLYAALAAGAGRHPRDPHFRPRHHRRDALREDRAVRVVA
jgi:adenine deaminase